MSVTCENSYLSASAQLQTLLRTDAALKINGIAAEVSPLAPTMIPALNCDNNNLSFIDLFLLSIGVDSCGLPTLRVVFIDSCTQVKNCSNNDYDFLNSVFVYDTVTKKYYLVLVSGI